MILGSPDDSLKVFGEEKSTSAIQEFLESGTKEVYHNPERPQRVSGNLTEKYGSKIDLKLLT